MSQHAAMPRRADDVVASANKNKELMRQLEQSLEDERLGIPPTPFREIIDEERRRRSA